MNIKSKQVKILFTFNSFALILWNYEIRILKILSY